MPSNVILIDPKCKQITFWNKRFETFVIDNFALPVPLEDEKKEIVLCFTKCFNVLKAKIVGTKSQELIIDREFLIENEIFDQEVLEYEDRKISIS